MKKTIQMLKDDGGAALMMAIFTVTMLMVIATEVMYETNVEYAVSSQSINQVKAHYAATAGAELSLFRIFIFRKAASMIGTSVPASMLDPIWQMPFAWPPIMPDSISAVDKDQIKKTVKTSAMQGKYFATIESEGSKLDLNDLASPSKAVAEATRMQLLQIFKSNVENNEDFARKYRGFDFEHLLNNITDWVDDDKVSLNGGDEKAMYPDADPNALIPPNQPFKTVQELHMVADMNDELYNLIAPRVTAFGIKGINVNYATKDVLVSLSNLITPERAALIIEARGKVDRGPFKDEKDFVSYLNTIGISGNPFRNDKNQALVPLIFDAEYNFRIRSTGTSGRVTREITAVVYDIDRVKSRLKTLLAEQAPTPAPTAAPPSDPSGGVPPVPTPTPAPTPTASPGADKPKVANERPNVVYWNEQ